MRRTRWIVTGGAGYIGAHVVRALQLRGRDVVVVDDLSTGQASRVPEGVELVQGSITDPGLLSTVLHRASPLGVIHLAGRKSVPESLLNPLAYAQENVGGTTELIGALQASGCSRVIFTSSCSVYGAAESQYVDESVRPRPRSPYGESKLYGEQLLTASAVAYGFGLISLRLFNVLGAAAPGLRDTGRHGLLPVAFRATRNGTSVQVFGGDHPTPDGTCIRDYVAVQDVSDAHVRAAEALESEPRIATYNVGRGRGSSVLEVLDTVRSVTGVAIDHEITDKRSGDQSQVVARVDRIARELGWTARHGLREMVQSAWRAEAS